MSCADVMYQPYASYFPYQRPHSVSTDPLKKLSRLGDSSSHLDVVSYPLPSACLSSSPNSGSTSPPSGHHHSLHHHHHHPGLSLGAAIKQEALSGAGGGGGGGLLRDKDSSASSTSASGGTDSVPNAQYLSSNCMLLTYFSGDISTNVDEHFSRALSQPSSFSAEHQGSKPGHAWKDVSPMASRNLPASFWNSSYHANSSHHDLSSLHTDPYMASSLHSMTSSLHAQDPWRYPLTSQSYTHPSVHDLAYPSMAASTSRYSHYGSLLPAAAGRLGAVPTQCDLAKHSADAWGSRYGTDPLGSTPLATHHDTHFHHSAVSAGGIESTSLQDAGKDNMYWF